MGRKQSRLSGLSFFVQEAFGQPTNGLNTQPTTEASSTSVVAAGVVRKASEVDAEDENTQPTKKRKVGLLGAGNEKYDATGLVPHYTDPSEVPEHLRKCTCIAALL